MVKSNTTVMAVVAMLVGLIFTGLPCLEAQSPLAAPVMSPAGVPMAMAPATDCVTALTNVSDCLTFVQVGSNMTAPDKACCPEFAGLLESNPMCLCQLVGQAESFGVDINRALMLPDACKVEIPSLDACPAPPISAPTPASSSGSEALGPAGSTAAPPTPASSSGSEAPGPAGSTAAGPTGEAAALIPAASGPGDSNNGASSTAVHDLSTFICLAVAIFIAYYF